jgi:hypothetical protein
MYYSEKNNVKLKQTTKTTTGDFLIFVQAIVYNLPVTKIKIYFPRETS